MPIRKGPTNGLRAARAAAIRFSAAAIALEGLRIVGPGASRVVRLVHRENAPRRAAIDALAASLRASAKVALAASLPRVARRSPNANQPGALENDGLDL